MAIYCGGIPSAAPLIELHPEQLLINMRAAVKIAGWLLIPHYYLTLAQLFVGGEDRGGGGRLGLPIFKSGNGF